MKYKTHEPYPYQLQAAQKAKDLRRYAFLFDVGAGKTFTTILTLRAIYGEHKKILKTLIFAPSVVLQNWKDEFKLHSFINHEAIIVSNESGAKRRKLLENSLDDQRIVVINWEAVNTADVYLMLQQWAPDIIVGDELHKIKTYNAKRSKLVVKLADECRDRNGYVFGLTGTPILNSIEDVYMQYRFLDGGGLFGKNFFMFRNTYMIDVNAAWAHREKHFPDYQPRTEMFKTLTDKMYSIASRITKKEALPFLPDLVKIKHHVELSSEQKRLYKQMKEEFIAFITEKEGEGLPRSAVANLALTKSLRLLQILSGFVTDDTGEDYEIKDNPRLNAVSDILDELSSQHKIILWCCFKHDYKILSRLCEKKKLKYVLITGEQTGKEKGDNAKQFQTDDETRIVIANRGAGGIGINLTQASYSVVYSRNYSLGDELQSEARNYRKGSEIHDKIVRIDLVAKDTLDEFVLEALNNKQKLSDIIIDWR